MPKVSIIIPVYNTVPYLEECLFSIVNQTLEDIEILIVDDGSTDGSSDIIDRFSKIDDRIFVIKQENRGQSIARNVALEIAKGDYIYFMDSDDILNKNALSFCLSRCEKEQLDLVFFDADILYEKDSKEICWNYDRSDYFSNESIYSGKDLISEMLDTYSYKAVPWLYFIKAEYINNLKLKFLPNIIHEDELFSLLLFLQSSKIGYLKRTLITHRIRRNSTMSNSFSLFNIECYLKVLRELHSFKENNQEFDEVIDKYTYYTMNAICRSAKLLIYKDRIKFLFRSRAERFDKYIYKINLLKLFI